MGTRDRLGKHRTNMDKEALANYPTSEVYKLTAALPSLHFCPLKLASLP
jgi:hypothetical protein